MCLQQNKAQTKHRYCFRPRFDHETGFVYQVILHELTSSQELSRTLGIGVKHQCGTLGGYGRFIMKIYPWNIPWIPFCRMKHDVLV